METAVTAEELRDINCPACRARLVTAVSRLKSWLPGELSRLRSEAIAEARNGGLTHAQIAARVGLTKARVTQILAGRSS